MISTPNELAIPPDAEARSREAVEVLRAWIVDGGLTVSFKTAFDDPAVWGVLLVDIARQVARAYQKDGIAEEGDALAAIRDMLESEWDRPTDPGTTMAQQ